MADAVTPFVYATFPENGADTVGRATPLEYRLSDYGGSALDAATLVVKVQINADPEVVLTAAGVLKQGVGWNASYVRYYTEAPASLADLKLYKEALYTYGDALKVSLAVDDGDGNAFSQVFNYVVRAEPVYAGDAPTPLEVQMATVFVNLPELEALRKHLVRSAVTDPDGANGAERGARRLLQVTTRTGRQPLVRYIWEEDPDVNTLEVQNGQSLKTLSALDGASIPLRNSAVRYMRNFAPGEYLEYVESLPTELRGHGQLASSVLALVVACRLRSNDTI